MPANSAIWRIEERGAFKLDTPAKRAISGRGEILCIQLSYPMGRRSRHFRFLGNIASMLQAPPP